MALSKLGLVVYPHPLLEGLNLSKWFTATLPPKNENRQYHVAPEEGRSMHRLTFINLIDNCSEAAWKNLVQ